ncbi:hypothetical protein D3C74_284300 [compost metagenome]
MSTVTSILLTLFVLLLILIVYPLIRMRRHLSKLIYDEGIPYLTEFNKTLVTISSAIVALTVSFIKDQPLIKNLLLTSWILLIACILTGILLLLLTFIKKLVNSVHLKIFEGVVNTNADTLDDEKRKKYRKDLKNVGYFFLIDSTYYYLIVFLVFLQCYSFVGALVYLSMAGYKLL